VPYEVSTRLCAQTGLASEYVGARKSLHIRPVAPGDTQRDRGGVTWKLPRNLGEESDTVTVASTVVASTRRTSKTVRLSDKHVLHA